MIDRTTKCPYCGYWLEDRVPYAKESIGPPAMRCPSCDHPLKTGMKYWPDMSDGEKTAYVLRLIVRFLYTVLFYTAGGCLVPGLVLAIFVDMEAFCERHICGVISYVIIVAFCMAALYIRYELGRIGMRPRGAAIPEYTQGGLTATLIDRNAKERPRATSKAKNASRAD